MNIIVIKQQPIELYKLLKLEALVYGGGEAKMVIADGLVKLNGRTETQKRKKILAGDIIEFNGESFQVELAPDTELTADDLAEVERIKQLRQIEPAEPTTQTAKKPKRRPIQF
ncbi:RNA-binding S4 domain-containing protein [Catenovulum sp. 2E275]|uniref:RNA-binding S4 domain-containing protein n=1 Tax=Catenovulum sp. 2E275 TaxID=2980497 RepID=UPI0021D2BE6C|nr:RNA-binding S4 domain-containing protein [Catenovulum sp. 2E275]MCU4677088.1 RNA-binding S4 domain-containing protein [Catenovulum sp. 2E275]